MTEPAHAAIENASSPNPFVFAVGCARSGTTLLTRMLDAHPRIAMTPETHWIPKFYEEQPWVTPDQLRRLGDYHRIRKLGLSGADLEGLIDADGRTPYAEFGSRFFDLFARRAGKALAGDKTPSYVRVIPFLHRLWPKARFIHLIRDGRDVVLSALKWEKNSKNVGKFSTWAEEPILTAALWWAWNVSLGCAAGRALGSELYHEISYEDLVAEPERECRDIAAFLGIEFDDAMLRFHEGRTRDDGGRSAKKAWLPPTPGLRDWRTQMSLGDTELFEAAAGDLLATLGYERRFPAPCAAARARAGQVLERFESESPIIDSRPRA